MTDTRYYSNIRSSSEDQATALVNPLLHKANQDSDRKCFKCGEPVKIESQGKGKGYRILNPDDSAHRCT